MRRLLTPRGLYHVARDQLGSIRGVYLQGDRVERRERFDGEELVLLLHGFFQTRNIWEVMEDRLRHDGYGVLSFRMSGLLWRYNTQGVDGLASAIAHKVEALAERHGFEHLHIVGHSKGGIVARRYVQHHGGARRVRSVITLGSPHHGTPTALVGVVGLGALTSNPKELLPRSRIVQALKRDTFPAHIPLTSVYSREDVVCPYWCSILQPRPGESSMENVQVRGVGHSQLTWDPGVYRIVRARLEHATDLWAERHGKPPRRVRGAEDDAHEDEAPAAR